jgi:hypothetical protein
MTNKYSANIKLDNSKMKHDDNDFIEDFKSILDSCNENNYDNTLFTLVKGKNDNNEVYYSLCAINLDNVSSGDEIIVGTKKCNKLDIK